MNKTADTSESSCLSAALEYLRAGFSVLPTWPLKEVDGALVCACDEGAKCHSPGKHPCVEWTQYQTRRASEDEVRGWFKKWPGAGVGIVTGAISGLVVLDCDSAEGMAEIEKRPSPLSPVVKTSKGTHRYFRHPGGGLKIKTTSRFLPGLDSRADGGFVVAPPSRHPSGAAYKWHDGLGLDEIDLPDCPAWMLDLLAERPRANKPPAEPVGEVIPEGQRNSGLASLAGSMRRRRMTPEAIEAALQAENLARCRPPLDPDEVRKIAESVGRYEASAETTFALTDLGNSERLLHYFGEDLRFVADTKTWLIWDGVRWAADRSLKIEALAKEAVRRTYAEAAALDSAERKATATWAIKSESGQRLAAAVKLAQSATAITSDQLDQDPWLLGCANGVIDLRTGELLPGRRENLITKGLCVDFDGKAVCPNWDRFLETVLPDPEVRSFIQKAVGYSLTGDTTEQVLFFLFGSGANGKSTFLEIVGSLLGDYYAKLPAEALMLTRDSDSKREAVALLGKRFVGATELSGGQRLREGFVKDLSGGDTLAAKPLYGEQVTFRAGAKLWLAGNHKPRIAGKDDGIWRRIRLVPFTVHIPEKERDRRLPEKLTAELPGVLRWAVEGCLLWQREGLPAPEAIVTAVSEYRHEQDALADFLADRCFFERRLTVSKKELWTAYREWVEGTEAEGYETQRLFNAELRERPGVREGHGAGNVAIWRGVALQNDDDSCSKVNEVNENEQSRKLFPYSPREKTLPKVGAEVNFVNYSCSESADTGPPDDPCTCGENDWRFEPFAFNGNGGWVCAKCYTATQTEKGTLANV